MQHALKKQQLLHVQIMQHVLKKQQLLLMQTMLHIPGKHSNMLKRNNSSMHRHNNEHSRNNV